LLIELNYYEEYFLMPDSLGKILKRIRESRHLSIEEVSERSRIPRNIISTIEEDRLNEIKSGFYAKSFVKTYASFLGAVDEPGVKAYLSAGGQPAKPISDAYTRKAGAPQIGFSAVTKHRKQIAAVIMSIFALWVLFAAIVWAGKVIKKKAIPKKTEIRKSADIVKETKKEVFDLKYDSVELEVFASDNTLLQVTADKEIIFKGVLKKGSKETWKAKKEIKLEAGNSGAIKININGKPAGFSGKKGEKKEITVTKDGIKN